MAYALVCVHPFHNFKKGQVITDPAEVAKHKADRGHHFVQIVVADPAPEQADKA